MKKFRSNIPRRKRSKFSPIIAPKQLHATSFINSTSTLTHDVTISCNSSSRVSTNNKSLKKRSYDVGNDGEFRRITRWYSKQLENNKVKIEVSEASSCIDLLHSTSKNVIRNDYDKLNVKLLNNDEVSAISECSVFPLPFVNGRDDGKVTETEEEETDVVSVSSKLKLAINEGNNDVVSAKITVYGNNNLQAVNEGDDVTNNVYGIGNSEANNNDDVIRTETDEENDVVSVNLTVNEGNNDVVSAASGKITVYDNKLEAVKVKEEENHVVSVSVSSRVSPRVNLTIRSYGDNNDEIGSVKTVNEEQNENDCAESKLISADFDLTCSERFTDEHDDECTMESSEVEFSSEFASSVWYDSGSQFSERSVGDTTDSPTFKLFVAYREKFCKSEFARSVAEVRKVIKLADRSIKLLRPEDEEHEESYEMLILRERRQLYLHDYSEEYCGMNDYGHLVVQHRLQMVHWIIEESASKELQKETMFLGVGLLDRFLSKGYFKNKSELEIAGIACLTLATRIEENQPFNSIRQKFFNIGSNKYSRAEVVAMEWLVQEVLNFQCFLPTIYNFLWFYLKAARASQEVDKTAKYLAVLVLLGHEQLCYWPSTVAASLVILACLAENALSAHQQIAWIYDGSNDKDLPGCIKCLEWLVQYIC